jgi:hypothetical protein
LFKSPIPFQDVAPYSARVINLPGRPASAYPVADAGFILTQFTHMTRSLDENCSRWLAVWWKDHMDPAFRVVWLISVSQDPEIAGNRSSFHWMLNSSIIAALLDLPQGDQDQLVSQSVPIHRYTGATVIYQDLTIPRPDPGKQ